MAVGTITQKIVHAHYISGEKRVGAQIMVRIDQTLTQDATGTMAYLELESIGVERVQTDLSISYVDHNMMQNGPENRNDHLYLQSVAAAKGILFSRPGNGICHQVHLERFGVPGATLLGSDSHTPTNGGIGMMAIGAGGLDVAMAMAGKPFTMIYPKVVGVKLTGKLPEWVAAKDVILKLLEIMTTKGNVGSIVEYFGQGVSTLSVPERATITNMGAELGVTTSIFPSDDKTLEFLTAQGRKDGWSGLKADDNAEYDDVIEIDLSSLEPRAACPSSPDNIKTVAELRGAKVGQVVIGSCTNSSYKDLMMVAAIMKGRVVSENLTFAIAPGSRQVLEMLAENGALADLIASGARILEAGCGACIGQGQSPSSDSVTVRTFNRNFAGRTGTKGDQAYLVSPETAAVTALLGRFATGDELGIPLPKIPGVAEFKIDDAMIIQPPPAGTSVEIIRKPTIGDPPSNGPLPKNIDGRVVIKVGDKITTDHIMPAGIHLKLRSNIPEYAKVVFECFNKKEKPTFAERASAIRDSGTHGVIVARESYGQGSSREHAAICPMHLGVKVVLAFSIERIHAANLVNFGIVPLLFVDRDDCDKLEEGAVIRFNDIVSQLSPAGTVAAELADGTEIKLKHTLSEDDIEILKAGGRLNI
ncbi:MAG: aconitate hydratase [Kiritimatiellaeota bacterium]|nr:aconitate hydratase [Kiritimatiellota bacterium]